MATRERNQTYYQKEKDLEVTYDYYHDPGRHTLPNGDPGYPPETEVEINAITRKGVNVMDLISEEETDKLIEEIIYQHD